VVVVLETVIHGTGPVTWTVSTAAKELKSNNLNFKDIANARFAFEKSVKPASMLAIKMFGMYEWEISIMAAQTNSFAS
jgi:hypothetical protein